MSDSNLRVCDNEACGKQFNVHKQGVRLSGLESYGYMGVSEYEGGLTVSMETKKGSAKLNYWFGDKDYCCKECAIADITAYLNQMFDGD